MNCLIDEELVTGLSPESGGQWLSVWMEISDGWCLLGVSACTNTLTSFIHYINSRVECTLNKFVDDTKLWDVVDAPEGWDTIQRNLDKLEQ